MQQNKVKESRKKQKLHPTNRNVSKGHRCPHIPEAYFHMFSPFQGQNTVLSVKNYTYSLKLHIKRPMERWAIIKPEMF